MRGSSLARLPDWLEPMAATLTADRFVHPAWTFERKFDGIRVLAYKRGSEVQLWSRNAAPRGHRIACARRSPRPPAASARPARNREVTFLLTYGRDIPALDPYAARYENLVLVVSSDRLPHRGPRRATRAKILATSRGPGRDIKGRALGWLHVFDPGSNTRSLVAGRDGPVKHVWLPGPLMAPAAVLQFCWSSIA